MIENRPRTTCRKELFDKALTAGGHVGKSAAAFMMSLTIQGGAIAALVMLPLMATDNLPTPEGVMAFMKPPSPPPPPLPPQPKAPPTKTATRTVLATTPAFVVPVEIPSEIWTDHLALDPGVPLGVEGGVPDGVLVGIVGGLPEAPPSSPTQEPVRVGRHFRAPSKIKDAAPSYPDIAKRARVEGVVILEAIIDPAGHVTNVRVLRSLRFLDQSAIDAVKKWKYEPTLLNGVPVPIVMTVTVRFELL